MSVIVHCGDSRVVMRSIPSNSVDGIVSDAPYALGSIVRRFGGPRSAPARSEGPSGVYRRASAGFMGEQWDTGEAAFDPAFWGEAWRVLKPGGHMLVASHTTTYHRLACAIEDAGRWVAVEGSNDEVRWEHLGFEIRDMISWLYGTGFPKSHNHHRGGVKHGTGLKPSCEPWALARKPLIGSVAENVRVWGTGALNIDGCRVPIDADLDAAQLRPLNRGVRIDDDGWGMSRQAATSAQVIDPEGRWPANVVTDGSDEVFAAFPQSDGQRGDLKATGRARPTKHALGDMAPPAPHRARGDSGSAARFFYSAKATKADRAGSRHPTVKPVALMQWLCRLAIPPGGVVLDPFAGSGTTGAAALREGLSAILIEMQPKFIADIERRLDLERAGLRGAA